MCSHNEPLTSRGGIQTPGINNTEAENGNKDLPVPSPSKGRPKAAEIGAARNTKG